MLFTVKQLLEMEGWSVDICRDGVATLKKLESSEHYDLIILDAELPGMRGLDLIRHARELMHRRRTSILMFSAVNYEHTSLMAGANAFLKKPSGIRDLIKTVKQLLDNKQSASEDSDKSTGRGKKIQFPNHA